MPQLKLELELDEEARHTLVQTDTSLLPVQLSLVENAARASNEYMQEQRVKIEISFDDFYSCIRLRMRD